MKAAFGITQALKASPAIQGVEMLTGPHNPIVAREGRSVDEILTTVMRESGPAVGVRDTMTCMVVLSEHCEIVGRRIALWCWSLG